LGVVTLVMADYYYNDAKLSGGRVHQKYVALGDEKQGGFGPRSNYHPLAEVDATYTPPKFLPNFDNTEKSGFSEHAHQKANTKYLESQFGDPDHDSYTAKTDQETFGAGRNTNHPYFDQGTLFDTIPSNTQITRMFADSSMSSTALTMAQLAKNKLKPEVLMADPDLSVHSSKLVQNAASRGLVETHGANKDAKITNDISTPHHLAGMADVDFYKKNMQPVTQGEVMVAQNDVRQSLRNSRKRSNTPVTKKGLSNQFLPGMEGFV